MGARDVFPIHRAYIIYAYSYAYLLTPYTLICGFNQKPFGLFSGASVTGMEHWNAICNCSHTPKYYLLYFCMQTAVNTLLNITYK